MQPITGFLFLSCATRHCFTAWPNVKLIARIRSVYKTLIPNLVRLSTACKSRIWLNPEPFTLSSLILRSYFVKVHKHLDDISVLCPFHRHSLWMAPSQLRRAFGSLLTHLISFRFDNVSLLDYKIFTLQTLCMI